MARQERKKNTLAAQTPPEPLKGTERQLCLALKAQYEAQVHRQAPNFKFNPRSDGLAVWRPAAVFCIAKSIDAADYVRFVIETCTLQSQVSRQRGKLATLFPEYFNRRDTMRLWEETNVISTEINPEVDAAAARRILHARCGTWAIQADTLQVLRGRWAQIPAYMRLALAFEDPEIWEEFSWEGLQEMQGSPGLQKRCREIGLRVDEWLHRAPGPIPAHFLTSSAP